MHNYTRIDIVHVPAVHGDCFAQAVANPQLFFVAQSHINMKMNTHWLSLIITTCTHVYTICSRTFVLMFVYMYSTS